jgi:ppGpp synthetase/RelA/SpoT-type nucleotidyltranferase
LRGRIAEQLRLCGIWGDVRSRTKSINSILKKLLVKQDLTYDTMLDVVGVRVIVRYRPEIQRVIEIVGGLFRCGEMDDKAVRLAEDGVGYLSIHTEARLTEDDAHIRAFPVDQFRAEVQMRTLAQHLWSEMSHDTFYKTDQETIDPLLRRRINLMAGLLEVADTEFSRLNKEAEEIPNMAEVGLLKRLESCYFQFTSERGNPDLSIDVIKLLVPLYGIDTAAIGPRVEDFVQRHRDTIAGVFTEQLALPEPRSIFFTQPEVLMLYERLEHDALAVRERWTSQFPDSELERIALAFGISFD